MATTTKKSTRKKSKRSVAHAYLHIQATFNNTIVTITDPKGKTLINSSAGAQGFKGSRKSTAYAAQMAGDHVAQIAKDQYGVKQIDAFIKGIGLGREAAVRAMEQANIHVASIKDITPVPHNGTRPRKAKRN